MSHPVRTTAWARLTANTSAAGTDDAAAAAADTDAETAAADGYCCS